jgi:hypothetical protein
MEGSVGIDWSAKKHDAAFMNVQGARIPELSFPHEPGGFGNWRAPACA